MPLIRCALCRPPTFVVGSAPCAGRGAYGIVLRADDEDTGRSVAIKRFSHVFGDGPEDARRYLRGMKILRHLCGHANVVPIRGAMTTPHAYPRHGMMGRTESTQERSDKQADRDTNYKFDTLVRHPAAREGLVRLRPGAGGRNDTAAAERRQRPLLHVEHSERWAVVQGKLALVALMMLVLIVRHGASIALITPPHLRSTVDSTLCPLACLPQRSRPSTAQASCTAPSSQATSC